MNFEALNHVKQDLPDREINLDRLKEQIFTSKINERILEDFEEDLYEATDNSSFVDGVLESINVLDEENQKKILSLPFAIRQRRFERILTSREDVSPFQLVEELLNDAEKMNVTIGYHISPYEIKKGQSSDGSKSWEIKGTELDDRDDKMMAYYSLDYENLYRKKRGRYIYAVRSEIGENSSHKQDNNNNWGRATNLSIISATSMDDLEEELKKEYEKRQTSV